MIKANDLPQVSIYNGQTINLQTSKILEKSEFHPLILKEGKVKMTQ